MAWGGVAIIMVDIIVVAKTKSELSIKKSRKKKRGGLLLIVVVTVVAVIVVELAVTDSHKGEPNLKTDRKSTR